MVSAHSDGLFEVYVAYGVHELVGLCDCEGFVKFFAGCVVVGGVLLVSGEAIGGADALAGSEEAGGEARLPIMNQHQAQTTKPRRAGPRPAQPGILG